METSHPADPAAGLCLLQMFSCQIHLQIVNRIKSPTLNDSPSNDEILASLKTTFSLLDDEPSLETSWKNCKLQSTLPILYTIKY